MHVHWRYLFIRKQSMFIRMFIEPKYSGGTHVIQFFKNVSKILQWLLYFSYIKMWYKWYYTLYAFSPICSNSNDDKFDNLLREFYIV